MDFNDERTYQKSLRTKSRKYSSKGLSIRQLIQKAKYVTSSEEIYVPLSKTYSGKRKIYRNA